MLAITAEFIKGEILLTVEHGNAKRVQVLRLTCAEMLAASATAELAIATRDTAYTRYAKGLPGKILDR